MVSVETRGEWTSGMTVTDFHVKPGKRTVKVATRLDFDGFWDRTLAALERIGK